MFHIYFSLFFVKYIKNNIFLTKKDIHCSKSLNLTYQLNIDLKKDIDLFLSMSFTIIKFYSTISANTLS